MKEIAERKLQGMLDAAGLPKKASYHPGEVCNILGISDRTFWRLVSSYEPCEDNEAEPLVPYSLDSYTLARSRRVRFDELVEFLQRNNTYERTNGIDPRQQSLFKYGGII